MQENKSIRPFGIRDKVGYMFGDFGNDLTFILASSFLMKFYTDVMAVPAFTVGIIMMIAKVADAFTDITMGRICDRAKVTKNGKFRPWLLRICGPVALASFLLYQSGLRDMSLTFKTVYLFVTYLLWGSVFYTAINIPYGSMASAISSDAGDRQSLSTFRTMGSNLAVGVLGLVIPMIAYEKIDGYDVLVGGKFTVLAGVFSLGAVLFYLLCYTLTTERVVPEVQLRKQDSVGEMLKKAFRNRALLSIIVASVFMLLSQLTMMGMMNYIYPNYYNNANAQIAAMGVMAVGMFVSAGIAKPLAKKYGKAEISVIANMVAAADCLLLFIIRPQNVWVYIVFQFAGFFGLGVFSMFVWALITDVIDDAEVKNGVREDGTVYSLYSFARKLGQAAASGLTGVLLSMVGYTEATSHDPVVLEGVFNISALVPMIGFLILALVMWFWYPLKRQKVESNIAYLKKKHGEI